MTHEEFQAAVNYWKEKDAKSVKMERSKLAEAVEAYIRSKYTGALATGAGDFVRCTPLEYSYHDGFFWIFSEGGEKFIALEKNSNVCLAIFDGYGAPRRTAWNAGHGQGGDGGAILRGVYVPCRIPEGVHRIPGEAEASHEPDPHQAHQNRLPVL